MSSELDTVENPRNWRFTWEAQSHVPTLRLLLFDSLTNPSMQCMNLTVHLNPSQSIVSVTWFQDLIVSIRVPLPRVLVDTEVPFNFRPFEDHIEVKFVLLLPVDHPMFLNFDNAFNLSKRRENNDSKLLKPLLMDSDQNSFSRSGGVHFYCRNCSFRLSKSLLREFVEMPSINWREVADNWFGTCCCSFGAISEKLVTRYTNSYKCASGVCLLSFTTITLSKDDLIGHIFPECDGINDELDFSDGKCFTKAKKQAQCKDAFTKKVKSEQFHDVNLAANTEVDVSENESSEVDSPHSKSYVPNHADQDCIHHTCDTLKADPEPINSIVFQDSQRSFVDGFLGNIFMARQSNLSADIEWAGFFCPQCSTLVGAYPCSDGRGPTDGGIRIFKCYVSTSSSIESRNLLREYTLERMFANQILESAKDESTFRTVVKDLKTKSPMLHTVLINSNYWSCSGYCLATGDATDSVPKVDLNPVIKVLFSDRKRSGESHIRKIEEWVSKDIADEVFMLEHQIEELIEILVSRNDTLPPSSSSFDGLFLSSILR